jgi:hypothetical protein
MHTNSGHLLFSDPAKIRQDITCSITSHDITSDWCNLQVQNEEQMTQKILHYIQPAQKFCHHCTSFLIAASMGSNLSLHVVTSVISTKSTSHWQKERMFAHCVQSEIGNTFLHDILYLTSPTTHSSPYMTDLHHAILQTMPYSAVSLDSLHMMAKTTCLGLINAQEVFTWQQRTLTACTTIPISSPLWYVLVNNRIMRDAYKIICRAQYGLYTDIQDIHCLKIRIHTSQHMRPYGKYIHAIHVSYILRCS